MALKSGESEKEVVIVFKCRTSRNVDVYWINYNGEKIKYRSLRQGDEMKVRTFETHPWVFRDSETFDVLVANNKEEVFMPQQQMNGQEDHLPVVTIDTPVWSLKEICMQHVRPMVLGLTMEQCEQLEIPKDLIRDIMEQEDRSHGLPLVPQ